MATFRLYPGKFVGPHVDKLPSFNAVEPPPSFGVAGYNGWWRASDVAGADGATIDSWAPTIGGVTLSSTGTARPTKTTVNGIPLVKFDGVNDFLNGTIDNVQSVTIIGRLPAMPAAEGPKLFSYDNGRMITSINPDGFVGAFNPGGTAQLSNGAFSWFCMTMSAAVGNPVGISVNAVDAVAANAVTGYGSTDFLTLAAQNYDGNPELFMSVEIAHVLTWPDFRNASARAAIRTAGKALVAPLP